MRIGMLSSVLALLLSLAAVGTVARAGGSFGVHDISVQTRDGSPWRDGAPIVLVVRATSPGMGFPDKALSVVMQTDGERTKCLDVAMKLVSTDGGVATYAGVFYPFRAATYDGRFSIGEDVHQIQFAVTTVPASAASIPADMELPVLGPVTFDYGPSREQLVALAAVAITVVGIVGLLVRGRRRTLVSA